MATVEERIKAILDNEQVKKAIDEEKAKTAALAKVRSDMGADAVKVYKRIEAEQARAARGPSEWTVAVKSQTEALNGLRGQVNQSGEALGKLAAGLSAISPELGTVVAGVQKASGVLSAATTAAGAAGSALGTVAAVAGPLAIAIGALVYAWQDYEESTRAAAEAQDALLGGMADVSDLVSRSSEEVDQLAVKIGLMSEAQLNDAQIERKWSEAHEKATEALRARRAEIEAAGPASFTKAGFAEYNAQLAEVDAALGTAQTATEQAIEAAKAHAEIMREEAESADFVRDREDAKRESLRASADAERELAAATDARVRNLEFAYDVFLREEQAKADARKADYEHAQWEKEHAEEVEKRELEAAKRQIELNKEAAKQREEARQADLEAVSDAADTAASIAGSISDVFGTVLDLREETISDLQDRYEEAIESGDQAQARSLKKKIEAEKEAAMKAWRAQQALSITSSLLDAASGVSKAAASLPPPANLIPIAAAVATGAANVAAVAAVQPPEFDDTPGVQTASAPAGRVQVSLRAGDKFAAAQDEDELRRQVGAPRRRESLARGMNRAMAGRLLTSDVWAITRGPWRRR